MKKIIAVVSTLSVIVGLGIFLATSAEDEGVGRIEEMGNITSIDARFKLESVLVPDDEHVQEICSMLEEQDLEEIDYDSKGWIYELTFHNDKNEQCKVCIIDERTISIDDVTYQSSSDIDIELLDAITGITRE